MSRRRAGYEGPKNPPAPEPSQVPMHVTSGKSNRRVLEYVEGRLDARTSPGQCVLHLAPGGVIRKIEWREPPERPTPTVRVERSETEVVDDILEAEG